MTRSGRGKAGSFSSIITYSLIKKQVTLYSMLLGKPLSGTGAAAAGKAGPSPLFSAGICHGISFHVMAHPGLIFAKHVSPLIFMAGYSFCNKAGMRGGSPRPVPARPSPQADQEMKGRCHAEREETVWRTRKLRRWIPEPWIARSPGKAAASGKRRPIV